MGTRKKSNKRFLTLVAIATLLALIGLLQAVINDTSLSTKLNNLQDNNNSANQYYKVTRVYDGDTIQIEISGIKESVRLIGVDTPETRNPRTPVQCFGPESSEYTKNNLLSNEVQLVSDPLNDDRDKYNRLLRYVYLKDGTLWNEKLIIEGYGYAYTTYPFTKSASFKTSEQSAKQSNKGLWDKCK